MRNNKNKYNTMPPYIFVGGMPIKTNCINVKIN